MQIKDCLTPEVAALAEAKIDEIEATYGPCTQNEDLTKRYIGGREITDIASDDCRAFSDVQKLRALIDQIRGGRARPVFILAQALALLPKQE